MIIYVRLMDENVDVWRPVQAKAITATIFEILSQPYDRDDEIWEFEPGARVICGPVTTSDTTVLGAIARADY